MTALLQTSRLQLRWLDFADAPFILELLNSDGWLRFIGDRGVRNLEDARNYIRHGPMATREKHGFALLRVSLIGAGDTPIGLCGLLRREELPAPDIGFAFLPQFAGQGYAVEAAQAVLQWGQSILGCEQILAITLPDNAASIKLLQRVSLREIRLLPANAQGEQLLLLGTRPT